MRNNNDPILEVAGLRKDFGRITALRGIDIVLQKPGVYGFLGPNGAGKTTTFKLICSLLRPTAGRVCITGIDVRTDPRAAAAKLGVLFDAPTFYPYLTGRENLLTFAQWQGRVDQQHVDGLLELVSLTNATNRRVAGYSWGMKQRLGLAAALLSDPQLILLDEPTNGLDPAGIADVRRLLPRLAYEQGRTVFLSSHRMDEVEQVCDRVTIIHQGTIVAEGKPQDLVAKDITIEIHCADPQTARTTLQKMDGIQKIEQTGGTRLVISAPGVATGKINRYLLEHNIAVDQVVEKRESLEEVFFRLTGMSGDEQ